MPRPLSTTVSEAVNVDSYVYLIAEASQRLVNRVVDDFIYEVMQPGRACRADVHRRSLRTASSPSRTLILSALYWATSSAFPWPLFPGARSFDLASSGTPARLRFSRANGRYAPSLILDPGSSAILPLRSASA